MTNINAVFVSINMYSSTLDQLIMKTDLAVDKLIKVSSNTKIAVSNMLAASLIADKAATIMQTTTNSLDNIADKMDEIGVTAEKVTDKLQAAGAEIGDIAGKTKKGANSIGKAVNSLNKAGGDTLKTTENIDKAGKAVDKLNDKAEKTKKSLTSKFKDVFGPIFKLDNLQKGMKIIDNMAKTNTKIGLVADDKKNPNALQDKIFAAAGNSRGSFANMAGTVTKLESTTGNLFKSNDETIAFTELAQRSFVAGGGSPEERSSAMGQLTDSMAGGGLKGEDLTTLAQTAPAIVDAISSYTGKTGNDLKALADQGKITSDVIKNSMFTASNQINDSFAATPMTFEDIWARIQDTGLQAFSGIMAKITEFISTPEVGQFINGLVLGIGMLADGISGLFSIIASGWSFIVPILAWIGTVVLIQMIAGLWAMIPPIVAQAVNWLIASFPLLFFIGLITAAIMVAISMGASFEDIFGIIGGLIGGLGTVFNNIFIYIWNKVAAFINFFGNVFNNPIGSILILFNDLAVNVIGLIENMVVGIEGLINRIPGVEIDISSGITDFKNKLIAQANEIKTATDYKTFVDTKGYKDIGEGVDNGSDKAKKLLEDAKNGFGTLLDGSYTPYSDKDKGALPGGGLPPDLSQSFNPSSPIPVEGTGPNGSMNVEMPDDDLDYLRTIAERDYIANVATNSLSPNISVQFGDVHENADANKVAGRIREILQNEIAMASEGVY